MPDLDSTTGAQLDKEERELIEDVVRNARERVEENVRFQLRQRNLDTEPSDIDSLDGEKSDIAEAIELEAVDGEDWDEAFEEYVDGVGYTIVNRLAALRCMEVRGFVDESVTRFRDDGLTPAADRLVQEEFLTEDEAIIQSYHNACDELADEIEILFDRSGPYSLVDPDDETFEDLCRSLDEIPDGSWRADDVLGWIYEYYNRPVVEDLEAKNNLDPEDVGPANQFYTPHWVVRMLTDNSLGKMYLEGVDDFSSVPDRDALSVEERKNRSVDPEASPTVGELCTYLIPDEDEQGEEVSFEGPEEMRVIDPACGSGHFLLYAFDVLERIWWAETDLDRGEIPAKILENNLYGVDIDLRSCQLAAFNLYLKARTRAEEEGSEFEMPQVGIVCADASVAEMEQVEEVFDEIADEDSDVRRALGDVLDEFQNIEALGSLLDVRGTISEEFVEAHQTELGEAKNGDGPETVNEFLSELHALVDERTSDSFVAQNLRSFLNLLVVLTQEYDVALMNPPYGSRGRMPEAVTEYVKNNYDYAPEYYVNFFETCDRLVETDGRVGMLVPWSFLFNQSMESFRSDFVGNRGSFEFLSEFGYDILDNATVGTVGSVVRVGAQQNPIGTFIRLHDKEKAEKESTYLTSAFNPEEEMDVKRYFNIPMSEFNNVPGTPICYSLPSQVRSLHDTELKIDPEVPGIEGEGIGDVKQGLATGDNPRFLRKQWEVTDGSFSPFTNAGGEVWVLPQVDEVINWQSNGDRIRRYSGSRFQNTQYYRREGLTWSYIKRTGRRFGYYPKGGVFGHASNMLFTDQDASPWLFLGCLNSDLFHSLMLCLTPERKWEAGYVGRLPWFRELESHVNIEEKAKDQYELFVRQRVHDVGSPYYIGPELMPESEISGFFYSHKHTQTISEDATELFDTGSSDNTLLELCRTAKKHKLHRRAQIESIAEDIDKIVSEALGIDESVRQKIKQEIWLRTVEDPEDREVPDPEKVPEKPDDFPEMVKDLVMHFALKAVSENDDGIVPLCDTGDDDRPHLLAHIEDEFERVFGEHADDRLAGADQVLGDEPPEEEAYPNLRRWLEDDLFDYHLDKFERTPILWRITSERLVSDPDGEGFACLVDYHQLDANVLDKLSNRYVEPRKNLLRDRMNAVDRKRDDDSLPASEQAEANEAYERYRSGLEQIEEFEDSLSTLAEASPRDRDDEERETAEEAANLVAEFREETERKLETVDSLKDAGVDMEEKFASSFYDNVQEQRDEWIDALEDLEHVCEEYAKPNDEPVEAHLYDLFNYYVDDLKGSSHFASNGILYMTYYFDNLEAPDEIDEAQSRIGGSQNDGADIDSLLAELATTVDEYVELAEEIGELCDELSNEIEDDWSDRALSEVTTAGYSPNRKHGVAINIEPLADEDIVPSSVEDDVL